MIARPNGVLPVVVFDAQNKWDDLLKTAEPFLDRAGLARLQPPLMASVKAVAVEKHYIDKDYRDTFTNYHAKRFSTPDSRCIRLHFFSEVVDHDMLKDRDKIQALYLGYSVIRPTRPNCVGRTLLQPKACGVTGAHISQCSERVSLQGVELEICGFPFISQDADVTVCAQSALWMVARYFSNRYRVYPEIYPYRLTALTQDYSIGRLAPSSGLRIWQMAEALRQMGFASLIYDRGQYPSDIEHLLYTYIESGIPVLAAFESHVVALFGHVSDFSSVSTAAPVGASPFVFSSAFNTGFIGHDDNGTPYQSLNTVETATSMGRPPNIKYRLADVKQFIAALPDRVFLAAESFQKVVTTMLEDPYFGLAKLSKELSKNHPLLRIFLTTGKSFKKRLTRGMGNLLVADLYRNLPLPHFIWVCEISQPSLYPATVLGEVLWDATRNAYEPTGLIGAPLP